ncbi:MAG: hypothetical protein U1D31_02860 [Patescibacteria group bacterium]|nr:hypothetical protein [bacterium]MDZ4241033.1 hypothetical protein [Patescibacteria group bacterium]
MSARGLFLLKVFAGCVAVFVLAIYLFHQGQSLIEGPILSVRSPINGATFASPLVEIWGTSKNISSIQLNDRPIFIDEEGFFKEKLLLSSGYNIIKFSGSDRFGRVKETFLELILKEYDKENEQTKGSEG